MTKQNSRRKRESKLEKFSLDELSQLFFFPQDFAAKMLNVSTSTLKRRFNELKTQHMQPVKWPYFRDSYTFFSQQTHSYKPFSKTASIQKCRATGDKSKIDYILNEQHITDPRIVEAETLGDIFRAHVQLYRREKTARRLQGELVNENIIMNPSIMAIKRNSLHPWQSKYSPLSYEAEGASNDSDESGTNESIESDEDSDQESHTNSSKGSYEQQHNNKEERFEKRDTSIGSRRNQK